MTKRISDQDCSFNRDPDLVQPYDFIISWNRLPIFKVSSK